MGDALKKLFGSNIKKVRKSKGLNRPDIASKTHGQMSPSRLSNYETGIREPDLQTIKLLAEAMETPVNAFFEGIIENQVGTATPSLAPERLAEILDEIAEYERQNPGLNMTNARRAIHIANLYNQPGKVNYQAEIRKMAEIIEFSKVAHRS
jgi:transcriptional regulator with XRE-family HTH domain